MKQQNAKLAEKKRDGLSEDSGNSTSLQKKKAKKKKGGFWGTMFKGDVSAISKRRKALDDALDY